MGLPIIEKHIKLWDLVFKAQPISDHVAMTDDQLHNTQLLQLRSRKCHCSKFLSLKNIVYNLHILTRQQSGILRDLLQNLTNSIASTKI